MLQPIQKNASSDVAYTQLRDLILSGKLAVGERLPPERKLSEMLAVSRGVVRESIKRLEQCGLVSLRQGSGATILDFRTHASTDLLVHLLVVDGEFQIDVAKSVLELRTALGADIARRCAERRVDTATLRSLAERMEGESPVERFQTNREFWELLVESSCNIAYRLTYNTVNALYQNAETMIAIVVEPELKRVDLHHLLLEKISEANPEAAGATARELLSLGEQNVKNLLEAL